MSLRDIFFLAVGLSMDAFAAAVCAGLDMPKVELKKAAAVGAYFGAFQALMPCAGFAAAVLFAGKIAAYDKWAAFFLLSFLGGKMIFESFKKGGAKEGAASIKPAHMLPLAFATSVDALAAGASLAFLRVNIISAALLTGGVTFILSALGVKAGSAFGARLKSKAELAGGVILILIGVKILFGG